QFPVLYGKYSMRGVVEKAIQHKAKPSAVWLSRPHLECCIFSTARGTVLLLVYGHSAWVHQRHQPKAK
uniref:Uncharacterized protein n=1 Tax=Amphimedon queenslandica TaxID=400682 RepID=A0A1X7SRS0_AMPQE